MPWTCIYVRHQTGGQLLILWTCSWNGKTGKRGRRQNIFKTSVLQTVQHKSTLNSTSKRSTTWLLHQKHEQMFTRNQDRRRHVKDEGRTYECRTPGKSIPMLLLPCVMNVKTEHEHLGQRQREDQSLFCRQHNDSVTIEIVYL